MTTTQGKTKEYTVRLPTETAGVLRTYSYVTGMSVNEIFKTAIGEYLQAHARDEAFTAAFDKVLVDHQVALDKLADL